jgi:MFS family permease
MKREVGVGASPVPGPRDGVGGTPQSVVDPSVALQAAQQDTVDPAPVVPLSPVPAAKVINAELKPPGSHLWTVGTLVYTGTGLALLFFWLLWGDFALSMRDRSVGPLIEKFLLRQGADNTHKQLLTATLPTVISLILGPIISYRSDRYRSRWGRRIPFLLIPTPIAGLAMLAIAFSPHMGAWLYTALGNKPETLALPLGFAGGAMAMQNPLPYAAADHTLGVFTVFWTIFEVAVIVSGSVFGGLINDVVPRPMLGRFYGLFRAVSLYDGILFNAILFKHAEQHFTLMFALVGLLFGGGFMLMCLKVREGEYPPPPPEDPALVGTGGPLNRLRLFFQRFFAAAAAYLHECFTQPYYLLVFSLFTVAGMMARPINEFSIRYQSQLKMPDSDYGVVVAASYVASLVLAFPLGLLVDRFHAMRMALVSLVLYAAATLWGAIYIHDTESFGIAVLLHTVLSGTYFTCAASLGQQLLPRAKFSQYSSAGAIVGSITGLIYAPVMGWILDASKNNYRLTYWASFGLTVASTVLLLFVYRRFVKYGGTKGYVAPGDIDGPPARPDVPHKLPTLLVLYFAGSFVGVAAGYVVSYLFHGERVAAAKLGLFNFYELIIANSDVRGHTTLCVATCVVPPAVLAMWFGSKFSKKAAPAGH